MEPEVMKKKVRNLMWQYLAANIGLIVVVLFAGSKIPPDVSHNGLKLAFLGGEMVLALIFWRLFFKLAGQARKQ